MGIIAVVAVAAWFRLYDLQNYPGGLFPDEAANGEDIKLIFQGDARPFYPRGNGREALFFYLQAASVAAFGIGVWQMHLAAAGVGILTVLATYFATRPFFGRLAGLLAAFFLATSHWHVTLSRTGFRAVMIPLFIAAFTAFVGYTILAAKKKKMAQSYIFAALAGAAFMGGFYTYIAYRVMVGVVLGIVLLLLMAAMHSKIGFPHVRRYGKQTVVAIIAALIVFAPLGWYFLQHPDAFIGRAGQVSVFSANLQQEFGGGTLGGTIMYSTRETLKSFFTTGDVNWRHNVSGYPLLNIPVGVLFLLGLAWAIHGTVMVFWKIMRGKEIHLGMIYPYILLLLVGMLLPVITTAEGMPHGLRSVGLIFPIFMLAGTAAAVVVHWVSVRAKASHAEGLTYGVLIGLLAVSALYDGALYFYIARNDSGAAYAYRSDLTQVSAYIRDYAVQHPDSSRPKLALDKFSVQTVHFLTHARSQDRAATTHDFESHPDEAQHIYTQVDPERSHLVPLEAGEIMIFTQSSMPDATRYEATYGSSIELIESRYNRFGQEVMRVYRSVIPPTPGTTEFDLDA